MWPFKLSDSHIYREKLCAAPGPGAASVNLALHRVCSLTSSSVSEWSVCEVCLSKHSPVMFTQQKNWEPSMECPVQTKPVIDERIGMTS